MSSHDAFEAFDEFESRGWERAADGYAAFFAPITLQVADPLLDLVKIVPEEPHLDVASGPGDVAARAGARGAVPVVGVDAAAAMLKVARGRWPDVSFQQGDAQDLPLPEGAFRTTTAAFVLMHVSDPGAVARELARVLTPGGRASVAVWDHPDKARLFGVVAEALADTDLGPSVGVPSGPPFFQFADDGDLVALLASAGLVDVEVRGLTFPARFASSDEVWHGMAEGTVRTAASLVRQSREEQVAIRQAFESRISSYRTGPNGHLEIPVAVKLAVGTKP